MWRQKSHPFQSHILTPDIRVRFDGRSKTYQPYPCPITDAGGRLVQRLQGRRLRTPLRNVSFLHVFLVVFQIDVYDVSVRRFSGWCSILYNFDQGIRWIIRQSQTRLHRTCEGRTGRARAGPTRILAQCSRRLSHCGTLPLSCSGAISKYLSVCVANIAQFSSHSEMPTGTDSRDNLCTLMIFTCTHACWQRSTS